jgi:ribose transport system ATP-binding protein
VTEALLARGLVKRYGGVTALAGAGISLRQGEIHALVGENGAGKSTLVKILCGVTRPDEGSVEVAGRPVSFGSSRDAAAAGIAFVAQELSLFPDLSVHENLFPSGHPQKLGVLSAKAVAERARPVFARFGLDVDLRARLGDLPLGDQQLLEICRAMLQQPRVLILDEPTSAQSREAAERLEKVLRSLADRGLAVLYISHFLEEVMRIADRISVLRDAHSVLDGVDAASVRLDQLVDAMIGGSLTAAETPVRPEPDRDERRQRRLVLDRVSVPGLLHEISAEIVPGEVAGFAGLQGAGHLTVLEAICGRVRPAAGSVRLPGGATPRSLRHAIAHGVGFVPSDRKGLGLMLDQQVWENVGAVSWLGMGRHGFWQRGRAFRRRTATLLDRLRVRGHVGSVTGQLSGGNQQKVVFAKWMDTDPTVMVLDDPTRGVDVGARAEMHRVVRQFAAQGKVVVVASTDLAELVELCDRVLVLQRGRIVAELAGERLDEKALSTAMNAGFVRA